LVPAGVKVHDTMVALYDGATEYAIPNFPHAALDKVLVPNLQKLIRYKNTTSNYEVPLILDPDQGHLLPVAARIAYHWKGSQYTYISPETVAGGENSLELLR